MLLLYVTFLFIIHENVSDCKITANVYVPEQYNLMMRLSLL